MTTTEDGNRQLVADYCRYDYSDEDDISSDSDTDSDGPPQKIEIERSTDLETLKFAFSNPVDKPIVKEKNGLGIVRVGMKNLNQIASTFENSAENVKKELDKEEIIIDKEHYSACKSIFENGDKASVDEDLLQPRKCQKVDIERTEADKKRVQKMFFQQNGDGCRKDGVDQVIDDKLCEICRNVVNHTDKIRIKRGIYHKNCFKCSECHKSLSSNSFLTVENSLFCKLHALQRLHPSQELTEEMAENMQISNEPDDELEDEEYAVVTQPKSLDPNIIRSCAKLDDEFDFLPDLSEKKKVFSEQADQSDIKLEKRTEPIDNDMFKQGQVKSRVSRFGEGENTNGHHNGDAAPNGAGLEDDEDYKNANITRPMSKKREELNLHIDSKSIKSKFESGAEENGGAKSPPTSSIENEHRAAELNALKASGAMQAKGKFDGQAGGSPDDEAATKRKPTVPDDITPVAAASIHEAKEKFMKGETAFHETSSSEKYKEIISFSELSSVKERFQNQPPRKSEERESIRPNLRCPELGNLKASFEAGGKKRFTEDELEQRRKKHLELEFKRLQIEKGIFNERQRREAEEEAKSQKMSCDGEEIQKCVELGSLKQRFELGLVSNDSQPGGKQGVAETEEGQIINPEAKNIKAKFESNAFQNDPVATVDKMRNIQAEFEQFKELKEKMGPEYEETDVGQKVESTDQDLALAAEHAQKMRAKWDKIQRKEAKRAQKTANLKQKQSVSTKATNGTEA